MNRWIVIGIVLVAIALVWTAVAALRGGVPVDAAPVVRADIREFVDEQGKTRLPRLHLITMPYDGRIEEITLREGDKVTKGQVVARLVAQDLENAVAESQAAVQRLQAAIEENDNSSVEEIAEQQAMRFVESIASTVAAAEAPMTSGQARLDYAEKSRGPRPAIGRRRAPSEEELERAELEHIQSQVEYQQDVLIWAIHGRHRGGDPAAAQTDSPVHHQQEPDTFGAGKGAGRGRSPPAPDGDPPAAAR